MTATATATAQPVRTRPSRRMPQLTYLHLAPFLLFFLLPIYWMVITAFKQDRDLYDLGTFPLWFSMPPTLEHVDHLLQDTLFPQWR